MSNKEGFKKAAAEAAVSYLESHFKGSDLIIGVGTGSTVNYFIEALVRFKSNIQTTVASSKATAARLKAAGFPVDELNSQGVVDVYVDGADEVNQHGQMIKGGGGALTGEKIVASVSKKFIVMVDESKVVDVLGKFPVAVEVIPMARSAVARAIVKLGGDPEHRADFVSDYGNHILDVHNFEILDPPALERSLNNISGVVCNGIFAQQRADVLIVAGASGVQVRELL